MRLSCGAATVEPDAAGSGAQQRLGAGPDGGRVGADGGQQRAGDALRLVEQGEQQVDRRDLGVALGRRPPHGGGDGFLALGRQAVTGEVGHGPSTG